MSKLMFLQNMQQKFDVNSELNLCAVQAKCGKDQ